jgi:hypothetical protein
MKFTQPVSMKCSQEQYNRDLKESLLAMGYRENNIGSFGSYPILVTNQGGDNSRLSNLEYNANVKFGRYFIKEYNPELFLALAGMTDSEIGNVGEWWKHITDGVFGFTEGKLYKQTKSNYQLRYAFLDDNSKENGNEGSNNKWFVKATKQEIINHFSNKTMNKVTVKKSDFKKLHDLACNDWKTKLNNFIARDFLYSDTIDFKSEFVNEMRSACTKEQLVVFKEIFGNVSPINVLEGFNGRPFFGELSKSPYIQPREDGEYTNQGFWLSKTFDWSIVKDEDGALVLLPKIKE